MATVTVEKNTYTVEPLYQWDLNQMLVIYGLSLASIPEVHFTTAAMGKAIVRQATMDAAGVIRAEVPNSLLQKPYTVQAYVCIYEGHTFETQYKLEIPVKARNKPEDYTLVDDPEVYSFNALENQVVNSLARLDAAEADYKEARALAMGAKVAYNNTVDALQETIERVVKDEMAGDVLDIVQAEYDTDGDGTVDRAVQSQNGLYKLTHSVQGNTHTLTGEAPTSGQFTVCFIATRFFSSVHQLTVKLNDSVDLALVFRGESARVDGIFKTDDLVVGTVVMESADTGTLYIESIPCLYKIGGHMNGSLIIDRYYYETSEEYLENNHRQVRNVTLSTAEPTGGVNGDLWLQYEE